VHRVIGGGEVAVRLDSRKSRGFSR